MKIIDIEEFKIIQMDILDVIHQYCDKHGIKYSLGCGSMLGAIRHKGFIPWDDDIDIYLLREEYEKLIASFPEELSHIKIASFSRDKKWGRAYAKAYDTRTQIIEDFDKYQIGVGIDVYPIDKVPQDEKEWLAYNKKRRFLQNIFGLKVYPFRKGRTLSKNAFLLFSKILLFPFSTRSLGRIVDYYAKKYNKTNSEFVFECCQGMLQKNRFKKELLETIVDYKFEDRVFKGMKDYDQYLSNAYGNYMVLPPEEKRVCHHVHKAWWKE